MEPQQQKKRLSSGQKTGFVLLLVFALMTVGLIFFQMRNTIYGPFVVHVSQEDVDAREALEFDEEARLQQIDTDHDGLNDYEELFFFETSPYIPDTDSDGLEDKVEIDQGTDPLCPEGQDCSSLTTSQDAENTTEQADYISPLVGGLDTSSDVLLRSQLGSLPDTTSTIDVTSLVGDATQLRQMLLDTGQMTEAELAEIDDETLMQVAQNLIEQYIEEGNQETLQ